MATSLNSFSTSIRLGAAAGVLLFASAGAGRAQLEPGTVVSFQQIATRTGGFEGSLDRVTSVARLGDVNGDGVTDIAVGIETELVWVLFLNPDGTVRDQKQISNGIGGFIDDPTSRYLFGTSVAGLGDLDGDGVGELAVGAVSDASGSSVDDAVWVLFLNSDGTVKAQQRIGTGWGGFTGVLELGDAFGASVAGIGDIDGDGTPDLAVGATGDDDGGVNRNKGAVWLLFLAADGTVKSHQKISKDEGGFGGGLSADDNFGISIVRLGDLDGDGIVELGVGATQTLEAGPNKRQAVWVLFLDEGATVDAEQKIASRTGGFGKLDVWDCFGISTAKLSDLDGDGVEDIVVGASRDDDGAFDTGAVWILFLKPDGKVKNARKISATEGGFDGALGGREYFGTGLAALGDLDGDGLQEIVVASDGRRDGNGRLWILSLVACGEDDSRCDDGNLCTLGDTCENGRCISGPPRSCAHLDDDCVVGVCDPIDGKCKTRSDQRDEQECDDGKFCTVDDTCDGGSCDGVPRDCSAFDEPPCKRGECNERRDECESEDVISDDDCDDANICTDDACVPMVGCVRTPVDRPCDDGDACTEGDTCVDAECVGSEVDCDDFNICTADICDSRRGCDNIPVDIPDPCSDGNVCTVDDACAGGVCVGGSALDCNDRDPCTRDRCVIGSGCSHEEVEVCTTTTTTTTTSTTSTTSTSTTSTSTTTTMLPPGGCGDPIGDGLYSASDALFTLQAAVMMQVCPLQVCDVDCSGTISATDALVLLYAAVGQPVSMCECDGPPTTLQEASTCDVTLRVADEISFIFTQFDVDYSRAVGSFVGGGADVDCTVLARSAAYYDNDSAERLSISVPKIGTSVQPLQGPLDLVRCEFEGQIPTEADFDVIYVDALGNLAELGSSGSGVCSAPVTGLERPTTRDAMYAWLTSAGVVPGECPLCECDIDNNGQLFPNDWQAIERASLGNPTLTPNCPACDYAPEIRGVGEPVSIVVSEIECF